MARTVHSSMLLSWKQAVMIAVDVMIVVFSSFLALVIRFDVHNIPNEYLHTCVITLPLDAVAVVAIFGVMRMYSMVLKWISLPDVYRMAAAVFISALIIISYKFMMGMPMPRSCYFIEFISIFLLVAGSRASVRMMKEHQQKKARAGHTKTIIYGAGAAGEALYREMHSYNLLENKVVCFMDDDPKKWESYLHGLRIAGGRDDLERIAKIYDAEKVIIALPGSSPHEIAKIAEICTRTGMKVRILPASARGMSGGFINQVRDVRYEDLLGREPVVTDESGLHDMISGKTVMVTGGAGSIGSEICRQVMKYDPKKLVVVDVNENTGYFLKRELAKKYGKERMAFLIGSVRESSRLKEIFDQYRPEIVFHAAAHKHVPMMEESPNESIKNNCMGTYLTAKAAMEHGAESFILISTDKAVRPTSIMGASKRLCEMIIQTLAAESETTRFAAVRFGNVLGSSGSVIPLFNEQIKRGGPVTVTHKEVTRFFMTIPEAVSLVLQTTLYAKGGEIFVLDMGEQVRIYSLAENLIRLQGLEPGKDIEIKIIGLRPGEKLYEELLMDEEGLRKTDNDLIFIGSPVVPDTKKFKREIGKLFKAAKDNVPDIKERAAAICETYTITDNAQETKEETTREEEQYTAAGSLHEPVAAEIF